MSELFWKRVYTEYLRIWKFDYWLCNNHLCWSMRKIPTKIRLIYGKVWAYDKNTTDERPWKPDWQGGRGVKIRLESRKIEITNFTQKEIPKQTSLLVKPLISIQSEFDSLIKHFWQRNENFSSAKMGPELMRDPR